MVYGSLSDGSQLRLRAEVQGGEGGSEGCHGGDGGSLRCDELIFNCCFGREGHYARQLYRECEVWTRVLRRSHRVK